MRSCVRCGNWHTEAERKAGRRLTCTEVRQHWTEIKQEHMERHGHRAQPARDESGAWVCLECHRPL